MQSHLLKARTAYNDGQAAVGTPIWQICVGVSGLDWLASSLCCSVQSSGRSSSVRPVAVRSIGCRPLQDRLDQLRAQERLLRCCIARAMRRSGPVKRSCGLRRPRSRPRRLLVGAPACGAWRRGARDRRSSTRLTGAPMFFSRSPTPTSALTSPSPRSRPSVIEVGLFSTSRVPYRRWR